MPDVVYKLPRELYLIASVAVCKVADTAADNWVPDGHAPIGGLIVDYQVVGVPGEFEQTYLISWVQLAEIVGQTEEFRRVMTDAQRAAFDRRVSEIEQASRGSLGG